VPQRVHGRYGVLTADAPWIHREGVLWHQSSATDLLFITLCTKAKASSPPPPATATWPSATGQRYIHHAARGSRVLLFVREQRRQGTVTGRWRSVGGWSGRSRRRGCW
jgi:hypothetical protein